MERLGSNRTEEIMDFLVQKGKVHHFFPELIELLTWKLAIILKCLETKAEGSL